MSRYDEDRRKRLWGRALNAILRGDLEEAERIYRRIGNNLGLAITALHARAWERAAAKALAFFDDWEDASPEERARGPDDDLIALRTLAVALERMEAEPPRSDAAAKRRAAIATRARERLDRVQDWTKVQRKIRELVRLGPEVFGPLASDRLGRNLLREGRATAADLLLEGHVHQAVSTIVFLRQTEGGAAAMERAWVCPHCFEQVLESPEGTRMLLAEVRRYARHARAEYAKPPPDRERALLLGAEAFHLAEFLARAGGDPVDDLLARSDELLRAAPGLPPAGAMKETAADPLAAFVASYRARVAESRGKPDDATPFLEEAASKNVEPWSERAAEALARLRASREAGARRRRVTDLRATWKAAKAAGDPTGERAALVDLLAVTDDDGIFEHLAILDVAASAPGATDRAAESVRRGSRDPILVATLAMEARSRAPRDPREAIPLFRLALRGGPLDPEASASFARALAETGRSAEAGKAFQALGPAQPERYLDAAVAFAAGGEPRRALAAIDALLDARVPPTTYREGFRLATTLAAPDALRPLAEKILARDPKNRAAKDLLARLKVEDFRIRAEAASRARSEGLAAFADREWARAAKHLSAIPEEFRDEETRRALAHASEQLGRMEDALRLYAALRPSREALEGRARCQARLGRPGDARETIRALLDVLDPDASPTFDDPNLLGLVAEARGDLRGAAERFEDGDLLRSLAARARTEREVVAEYTSLARLADRQPAGAAARDRLAALDALVPVRAKGWYARDLPTLVLCDTNVLVADLLEVPGTPASLDDLRRPAIASRLRELRGSAAVRLAVTRTVARELRAVLRYQTAIQEDEEGAEAVQAMLARAGDLAASLDVSRVARVVPRMDAEDVERVRAFYRPFRKRLHGITERKARRAPDRSQAIRQRRTRGKASAPSLPEPADLRLLAEAAWLADAPVAGIGGVGLLSDDADFREFRAEIERAFGVRVY